MDVDARTHGTNEYATWSGTAISRGICLDTDLVAGFIRELRAPLTSILGAADLLAEPGMSPDDLPELRRMLVGNTRSFQALVARFEDAILLGTGILEPTLQSLDARKIVERAVRDVCEEHGLREDEIEISTQGAEATEPLLLDAERLRFVIAGLVTQSLHGAATGPLVVQVHQDELDGDMRRLRLDIGPAAESVDAPRRRHRCVGAAFHIGVATGLVHALGGEVCVGDGGGRFGLVLPARAGSAMPIEEASPTVATDLTGVRVLLAEDGSANQKVLATMLRRAGATVQVARNGEVAVELAGAEHERGREYDVILMDLHMPVLDGIEATKRLREMGIGSPILAVTADHREEERARCLGAGFQAFLAKPVARHTLLGAVRAWSDRNGKRRAA